LKAVILRKHGSPNVLSYENFSDPKPKKNHVIIKVSCCAVNHLDVWVRKGLPGKKISFPHILGCDICGTLQQTCGNLKKGEKVIVYPVLENTDPLIPSISESQLGFFTTHDFGT